MSAVAVEMEVSTSSCGARVQIRTWLLSLIIGCSQWGCTAIEDVTGKAQAYGSTSLIQSTHYWVFSVAGFVPLKTLFPLP